MQFSVVVTTDGTLIPAGLVDQDEVEKLTPGQIYQADVKRPRNYKFLRKFMAMLRVGFDAWEPSPVSGKYAKYGTPEKNFQRFRKEVVILAGFYEPIFSLKGDMKLEAKSISFSNMDEEEFEQVYSKVADILLQRILPESYSSEELDNAVEKLIGFVG